ncbi:MAG: hypothetical protein ACK58N_19910 [Synechocystis sp.]
MKFPKLREGDQWRNAKRTSAAIASGGFQVFMIIPKVRKEPLGLKWAVLLPDYCRE